MKTIVMLAGALALVTVVAVALDVAETAPEAWDRWQVVSDVSQQEMLDGHQPMMEQMRGSVSSQMVAMMRSDPMRTTLDADMVTLMEQNQAQIDRMLARP